jgi:hypothetical protein
MRRSPAVAAAVCVPEGSTAALSACGVADITLPDVDTDIAR